MNEPTTLSGDESPAANVPTLADLLAVMDTGELHPPATEAAIAAAEQALNFTFPDDYKAFLRVSNGYAGGTGDEYYDITIWTVEDIVKHNTNRRNEKCKPGSIVFGANARTLFLFLRPDTPYQNLLRYVGSDSLCDWPTEIDEQSDHFADFILKVWVY